MADESSTGIAGRPSRALVLGGGGPVGRAWQMGLMNGFIDRGIDFGTANLIIGTSAGAVVGALLALDQVLGAAEEIASPRPAYNNSMADLAAAMVRATQSPNPEPIRAEIGKMALNAQTVSEEESVSRPVFASFVGRAWPNQFRATTVNARTGQLRVWDAFSGAPLERAVAASAAAPLFLPPITIHGDRYIDGGVRSLLNADLAIGSEVVVAVSCFPLTDKAGAPFFMALIAAMLAELEELRGSGATVAVIEPDADFLMLTKNGAAMMDSNLAPDAYRLGHATGIREAVSISRIWK